MSALALPRDGRPLEQRAREAWEVRSDLREEFSDFEIFLAYARAVESGRVVFLGRAP